MVQTSHISFNDYSFAGDVATIATCAVILVLVITSYVSRTRSYRIFMAIIVQLICAALVNIVYHMLLLGHDPALYNIVYVLRILYQILLFDTLFLFALYTVVASGMDPQQARIVAIIATLLLVVVVGYDIIRTAMGAGFQITADGTIIGQTNIFLVGYLLFIALLTLLLIRVRHLLYRRVVVGFFGTMAIAVLIRLAQVPLNQTSLTTMTFVFPVIAMLYIMHSNPYNVSLGSVDIRAMEDMVQSMHAKKEPFVFLALLVPEYDEEGLEFPEEIKAVIRGFTVNYFRNCVLFQISNGHVVLMAPKRRNPDFKQRIESILSGFQEQYQRFKRPYKIVIGESVDEISEKNEYASLIQSIEQSMPTNSVRVVSPDDIARFKRTEYILSELADISNRRDMEDPRVLAYCQPVFNLNTGLFDTAEALMRLKLDETGLVFPDQFIPLAEKHGYIHTLTEIILNKTCREIRRLAEDGFQVSRISVNVSALELKLDGFCEDIDQIIADSGIPGDKIAIELTESGSEADFMIMKEKIEELRRRGIQFYLDDFGTGYSNMERIMELPFDIIKFDRSLVIACRADERSEKIVENLAQMFRGMDYSVLYEGVEDDTDEERCRGMSASYLQGYKYSRPIPIEELRSFLSVA